jgi:hypothetical protein
MTGARNGHHLKSIFSGRVRPAAAISALVLGGGMALSVAPAQAGTTPASPHGVRPLASGNIFNVASGKCLGTNAGHNNTYTVLWTCNGTRNQAWTALSGSPYGKYNMIKNENGDCLGLSGAHVAQGTSIVAATCNPNAKNQYWWHLYESVGGLLVLCNLLQPCQQESSAGRVAGVADGGVSNGAKVVLWDNDGHQDQDWDCASACLP